jgi:uncharacterized protein involved in exopolysaccharide biosynthesis
MATFSIQEIILMFIAGGWRRRYIIATCLCVMPVMAFVIALFSPKYYETKMTILVQEPAKSNPFLNDWAVGSNLKDRMPGLKALLNSEHVLGKVLLDTGKITPNSSQAHKNQEIAILSESVKSNFIGSDIIEIKLRSRQKQGLAKTLSAVGIRFTERLLAPEQSAVTDSETFLQNQLELKRKALNDAEEALSLFKTENADKLPTVYVANVQKLSALKEKLEEKTKELANAKANYNELKMRLKSTNPLVGRVEDSLISQNSELTQLRIRYTDEHSEVIVALKRIERLKAEKEHLLKTSKEMSTDDVDRLWNLAAGAIEKNDKGGMPLLVGQMQRFQETQSRQVELENEVKQLNETLVAVSQNITTYAPVEQKQAKLERAVTAARELYDLIAKRYELSRITGALGKFEAPERVKILDAPFDPSKPINLPLFVFVLLGIVGGLVLGCALAVVYEFFDDTLRTTRQFRNIIPNGVISRLPRVREAYVIMDSPPLVPNIKPKDILTAGLNYSMVGLKYSLKAFKVVKSIYETRKGAKV